MTSRSRRSGGPGSAQYNRGVKTSCVLLAINRGGVVVAREYLVDVDEPEFIERSKAFQSAQHSFFMTFLSERELNLYLDEIRQRRLAL